MMFTEKKADDSAITPPAANSPSSGSVLNSIQNGSENVDRLRGWGSWLLSPWRAFRIARRFATPVTTRLTREGWQFAFMICFIVLGAVLRDVNLLVILAGTLLALMLMQWRVCAKTLYGLHPFRRLPKSIQARKEFEVELEVTNPKRWLGAWLVQVQERIVYAPGASTAKQVSQTVSLLFPLLPPKSCRAQKYRCSVQRRGNYQFLDTEISTRFPLGLMRSFLQSSASASFIAQPAIGRLLPGWLELFEGKITGVQQRKSRSISDEGEFFGLRAYQPGDSPRWIHWRSSARLNELMVKQFQRSDSREFILVLDLCLPPTSSRMTREEFDRTEDLAIEFAATIANHMATSNNAVLTLAIADSEPTIAVRVQTRAQNTALLDRLGTAHAGEVDGLPAALEMLEREYRRVENLLVVSTRPKHQAMAPSIRATNQDRNIQFWKNLIWLNVANEEIAPYFQPIQPFSPG